MIDALAAVQYGKDETPQFTKVVLAEPGPGEVLVRVKATGICHTDYSAPGVMTPLPLIPGHEGGGIVVAVGEKVVDFLPGDQVLMSFGSCGRCERCDMGHPNDCYAWPKINFGASRGNGEAGARANGEVIHASFFCQSSFASMAVATERNLVKIGSDLPLELYAPLGCGLITGAGAVMNVLKPEVGGSIVIFGAGTVGLSAVMASVIRGCKEILVIDINEERLALAHELGATHLVNSRKDAPVAKVREVLGGGADYSVETAGVVDTFTGAIEVIKSSGICALLTVPSGMFQYTPAQILFGKTVRGVIGGGCDPRHFIPELIQLHQEGRFPLEKLITYYDFEELPEALRASRSGEVVKAVLRM